MAERKKGQCRRCAELEAENAGLRQRIAELEQARTDTRDGVAIAMGYLVGEVNTRTVSGRELRSAKAKAARLEGEASLLRQTLDQRTRKPDEAIAEVAQQCRQLKEADQRLSWERIGRQFGISAEAARTRARAAGYVGRSRKPVKPV